MDECADDRWTGWGHGTTVSVFRLPSADQAMARAIGIGELATRLEVGQPLKLRLDSGDRGRVMAGTTVVAIQSISPDVVRIATRNHRYELRQIVASLAGRASPDAAAARNASDAQEGSPDRTQVVSVSDWPQAEPGRMTAGARVLFARENEGEVDRPRLAILLGDLVPGESASFSLDGRIVTTSPVREVIAIDARCIRLSTGNSSYRLELLRKSEGENPVG